MIGWVVGMHYASRFDVDELVWANHLQLLYWLLFYSVYYVQYHHLQRQRERYRDPEISWGRYFLSSVYEVFANSDHSWIREIAWFGTKVRVRYADSPGYPGEYLYLTCQWDPSRDCCGWVDYCGKSPLGGERLKLLSPWIELEHSSQCMNKHSTNVLLIDSIIM